MLVSSWNRCYHCWCCYSS